MKRYLARSLCLALLLPVFATAAIKDLDIHQENNRNILLLGPDASRQLVVTGIVGEEGAEIDLTGVVQFHSEPEGIVRIDASGSVTPLRNGDATITATHEGYTASVPVTVREVEIVQPVNFANEIVPLFTKFGCNGGGCHGKSEGQNGFKLSLLGFEPENDYDYLVKQIRGRRLFPAAPQLSLLLRKATGEMPHGGGSRLDAESPEYQTLIRWMEQGVPYGKADDPVVERIAVYPRERIVSPGAVQQLNVTAFYSDGSRRDITRVVQYESNQKSMAEVNKTGLVTMANQTGDISIMIRFQELVDVFRATIPLGEPVDSLPPVRNFIDELVYEKLETLGLPPSQPCDDATFLRRTAIDITGKLPDPDALEAFYASSEPNRRTAWIHQLLESRDYGDYFANKWNAILRNKRERDQDMRRNYAFHDWLRQSLNANKPFDQLVSKLVSATGEVGHNPAVGWYRAVNKRQEQLQDVAQVFLGVRLQCAQCHHHPYEKWSQEDYYGFSAFFAQVGRKPGLQPGEELIFHRRGKAQDQHPKTQKVIYPTPLGGMPLDLQPEADPREALASWMVGMDNPFFARMLVNRYWKHFFGRGLVEPEDDMRVTNPATNPKLLDDLANYFIESGFDLKALIVTICDSQTYQLSAIPNEYNRTDSQNYSRFYPRRLTAEVLLDSIDNLTGVSTGFPNMPAGTRAVQLPDDSFNSNSYFLTVFGRPEMDSACECERTQDANLAQSLHLLNSKGLQDKLTNDNGRAAELAADRERPVEEKIADLYLRAFSRPPSAEERELAVVYIENKRQAGEAEGGEEALMKKEREAFEDILWALINTKEFLFNH